VSKNVFLDSDQEVAVMIWNFLTWMPTLWISFRKGRAKFQANH